MDYSAANFDLWNIIVQFSVMSGAIMLSTFLRQRTSFIRKTMMPVAVLAGFLLLILKYIGLIPIDANIMEVLVYHGIALGFIAMSLRVPPERQREDKDLTGLKSGAVIVSTYLVQGAAGLAVTLLLGYTLMPDLFKASGLLLPMGFGQGPGQANNIGSSYEALGFAGGRSFGLSIAASGYLVACIVGVIILNVLSRSGKIGQRRGDAQEHHTIDFFEGKDEIPVADSIDKFSIQFAMVFLIYLATYLAAWGVTSALTAYAPGLANMLNSLIWGFNFIIGAALAMLVRTLLEKGKRAGVIKRQYQNNYLLNRISGFFFDIMIIAGIASIDLADVRRLWLPFVLLTIAGAALTWIHLRFVCKKVYKGYYYEGLISMYGMLTGTISSGVMLLREIDPDLSTPAANNLITGSSVGIVFGVPVLVLVSLAPRSDLFSILTIVLALVYLLILLFVIFKVGSRKNKAS